jgi:uncharacterized protein YvpB
MVFVRYCTSITVLVALTTFLLVTTTVHVTATVTTGTNTTTTPPSSSSSSVTNVLNVPYHRQVTTYSCGDASAEMMLNYYGVDVDQYAIIDVARTTNTAGSLVVDIDRALRFSKMSSPPLVGNLVPYPGKLPTKGYTGRPYGLITSVQRNNRTCWIEDLKAVVQGGNPVGVLMFFDLTPPREGHFRVVIGYDESSGNFTLLDPWDRQDTPRVRSFSPDYFCQLWNHSETDYVTGHKYAPFAAVYVDQISITNTSITRSSANGIDQMTVQATASYKQCILPFECPTLDSPTAMITLPDGWSTPEPKQLLAQTWNSGSSALLTWKMTRSGVPTTSAAIDLVATIHVGGIVSGTIPPRTGWNISFVDPGYSYQDLIGNSIRLSL